MMRPPWAVSAVVTLKEAMVLTVEVSGDRSGEYFQCGKVFCKGDSEMLLCFAATVPYDVDAVVILFGMIEGVGAGCLQTMRGFIWQEGRYPHEVSFRPEGPGTEVEGVLAIHIHGRARPTTIKRCKVDSGSREMGSIAMRCLDANSAINDGRVSTSTAAMRCQQSILRNNDMPRCTYLASTGEKAEEVERKGKRKSKVSKRLVR